MSKIILSSHGARTALEKGVDLVANAVKVTMGPKGRNVVLDKKFATPLITNDGVTIAKEIDSKDPFVNMGAQLIKEASIKTNEVAGDGTTTAVVLAQVIVKEGLKNFAAGANPVVLKKGILKAVEFVVEQLKKHSRKVNSTSEIEQVASISAGDIEVGKLIAKAISKVGKDGVITAQESNSIKTELSVVEGMQFERGYLSPYMSTDMEKMEALLENPLILITDEKISSLQQILPILEKVASANEKLLIIADDVDGEALAGLVLNKLRGNLVAVAVRAPSFGETRTEYLKDIAILTGGTFVSKDLDLSFENLSLENLGRAKKVKVSKETTTIIEGFGDLASIKQRANTIKNEIENSSSDFETEKLKERLAKLSGGIAVINVGAPTEVEMKEKKLRIDDALASTKAALLEGIVAGGGSALLKTKPALEKFVKKLEGDEKTGAKIVLSAIEEPIKQIAENSGICGGIVVDKVLKNKNMNYGFDAYNNKFGDMFKLGIIDPTKVTRSALQNAGSVSSTLLTTECLVAEENN